MSEKKTINYEKYCELLTLGLFAKPINITNNIITFDTVDLIKDNSPKFGEQRFRYTSNLVDGESQFVKKLRMNCFESVVLNEKLMGNIMIDNSSVESIKQHLITKIYDDDKFSFEQKLMDFVNVYCKNTKFVEEFSKNYDSVHKYIMENFEVKGLNTTNTETNSKIQ